MTDLATIFKDISSLSEADRKALQEYIKSVELLSADGLNLEFNNKDQFHAAIVMSAIFEKAEKNIKVFTGSFSGDISDNPKYLNSLKSAIGEKNINIEVIFEQEPNNDSECLRMLRTLKSEGRKVSMHKLKDSYRNKLGSNATFLNHFTIGDDRMFRYETEKTHFKAFCNFDDKSIVTVLSNNFSIFRLNSTEFN